MSLELNACGVAPRGPRAAHAVIVLVMAVAVAGIVLATAVAKPAWADGFGPLALTQTAAHWPLPYRGLIERWPHAYAYGVVFPELEAQAGTAGFTPLSVRLHDVHLAWDLLTAAATDEDRSFALGYLTHLAADLVFTHHFLAAKLAAHSVPGLSIGVARELIRAVAEVAAAPRAKARARAMLRQHTPEGWYLLADVLHKPPYRSAITPRALQTDVGLFERALERSIARTGPELLLARGLGAVEQRLGNLLADIIDPKRYRDLPEFLKLAVAIARSLVELGERSPWYTNAAWTAENPYPALAAQRAWPERFMRQARRQPDPAATRALVLDAAVRTHKGVRVDRIGPAAGAARGPFTARVVLAAWRPVRAVARLRVFEQSAGGRPRLIATRAAWLSATAEEIAKGRTLTLSQAFAFAPHAANQRPTRIGYALEIGGAPPATLGAPPVWPAGTRLPRRLPVGVTLLSTRASRLYALLSGDRTDLPRWPFGLAIVAGLPAPSAARGRLDQGTANARAPGGWRTLRRPGWSGYRYSRATWSVYAEPD